MLLSRHEIGETSPEHTGMGNQDNNGRTALHWSAEYGHEEVTKLLATRVDHKVSDRDKNIALHRASQRGHKNIVAILETDLKLPNKDGKTPFHLAVENGHEDVAWLFFQNPKLQHNHCSMALFLIREHSILHKSRLILWAAKAGYANVIESLFFQAGADTETTDEYKRTPLSYAAEMGHEAMVRLLLEKGADANVQNNNGETALHGAAENGHEAVIRLLLEKGADANVQTKDGWTARYVLYQGYKQRVGCAS